MIELGAEAAQQIDNLRAGYEAKGRSEATRNLIAAVIQAAERIERNLAAGLPAPRPYPELARPGEAWIKAGRYWVSYSTEAPVMILAVFYDAANIPGRAQPPGG